MDGNAVILPFSFGSNRTFMELKFRFKLVIHVWLHSSNRTFMELKCI